MLLLLAWVLMRRAKQPARRQRLGEWGILAALLLIALNLGPTWLAVPAIVTESPPPPVSLQPPNLPLRSDNPRDEREVSLLSMVMGSEASEFPERETEPFLLSGERFAIGVEDAKPQREWAKPQADASSSVLTAKREEENCLRLISVKSVFPWLMAAYGVGAVFFLGRWLLGSLVLWRLLRTAEPAPRPVAKLFAAMSREWRIKPRLLVSSRLRVPLSCSLLRPTVVLPAALCEREARSQLRWVFAHELTHLERRDAWACVLLGLGQALYFYWPWFWWLRRQVRLCQEYIADAAVVRESGQAEDYAEFLLSLMKAPAVPAGATGVMGNSSDLFRRVTMLLKTPHRVEKCCPWRWTLAVAGGLLVLAVIVAGIGPEAKAAPDTKAASATDPATDNKRADDPSQDKEVPSKDKEKKKPPRATPPADNQDAPLPPAGFPEVQPPASVREEMQRRMMMMQRGMMPGFFGHHARLGVQVSKPSDALVDQLDLPKDQGQVIEQVIPDSAAAKAGLKRHDVLLELNGKAVPADYQEFVKEVAEIKADAKVDAVVLRKGKKEMVKGITLPDAKPEPVAGFGFPGGQPGGFAPAPALPQLAPLGGKFIPQPPQFGGNFQPAGNTVMTTMFRTNDRFTTRHQEGSLIITVTGKVADGKTKLNDIQVQDGQVVNKYESVDKVPDQYQDKVKNLVEMSDKSSLKIEIKTP
jgi:beta-lactamase regulating signal transducer with metallopeptidase domain